MIYVQLILAKLSQRLNFGGASSHKDFVYQVSSHLPQCQVNAVEQTTIEMTTDYSKWDRICADLSSDEEEKSVAPRLNIVLGPLIYI